jgi:peptide/nickel transport system permease protein
MGAHPMQILARTVLPNIMPPLLVQMSLVIASALVIESGLSFLGLGVVPPTPSWGLMIRAARGAMEQQPLLLIWPSLALAGTIFTFNLLCDRLQSVLDPRGITGGGAFWLRKNQRKTVENERVAEPSTDALLLVEDLSIVLGREGRDTELVRGVSFKVVPGETRAIVGESGSGKTLSGLALNGLLPDVLSINGGRALFSTREGAQVDLTRLDEDAFRSLRGREVSMVFQDAAAALNPVLRIGEQVGEAIRAHKEIDDAALDERIISLLRQVGLPDPERRVRSYPHELSGGQRQRAMIAVAVANEPRLLIADEPTTALDPTIQAQILDLFKTLMADTSGMGLIFVTHDLAVVSEIADRVTVMYAGEVVEEGPVADVFERPRHPYTAALIASVPEGDADRLIAIPGTVPTPKDLPPGCRFAPRCAHAIDACTTHSPEAEHPSLDRRTRCIRWKDVT